MADAKQLAEALQPFVLANNSGEYETLTVRTADITRARQALAAFEAQAAGALTDEQVEQALNAGGIKTQRFMGGISGTKDCWSTAGSADLRKIAAVVRKLAAPVAQAEPAWMPIETAPKDGSTVLLLEKWAEEPFIGHWREFRGSGKWVASTTHYDTDGNACVIDRIYSEGVSFWMPIPQPPKENP
jgi:hypothetical protein